MSEHAEKFVAHLNTLNDKDRGAMAALRHSLAFEPGAYPKAYPYVESFVGSDTHERDAYRLALYAVAGLFARHPHQRAQSLASAFGELMQLRSKPGEPNKSIESRFIALLGADAENVVDYLRQIVTLLASDGVGLDYARLLVDLSQWLNPHYDHSRLRQRWAREFYRSAQSTTESTDNE